MPAAPDLIAGVDSSTQSCKVELRRLDTGELLGTGAAPHPATAPPISRQDPREWWGAFSRALAAALRTTGSSGHQIRGISVAAQCHGMVALDSQGEPLTDAPLWNDTTAAPAADRIRAEHGESAWMRDVGLAPSAALTIMKVAQLARTRPELLPRISRLLVPHDYLTWRLTGQAVTDRSDASGTGWFDVHRGVWRAEILERYASPDIDWLPLLPRVLGPTEAAGTLLPAVAEELGLREDTVVGPGGGDQHLAAVGLGLEVSDLAISLGTSGVVFTPTARSFADPLALVDSVCDATGGHLLLACTLNAAKVTDTVARILGVGHPELERLALSAPRSARRPVLLAHLDGERTPPRPGATGILAGLTTATTREEVALAAYEGVVAGLMICHENLLRVGAAPEGAVIVNGGGARSLAYRRLLADALDRPVIRRDADEAPARGACIQAASVLLDADITELAAAWRPPLVDQEDPSGSDGLSGGAEFDRTYYDALGAVPQRP